MDDAFIEQMVKRVTAGFKGDVGVVPRQFLRALVTEMDVIEENDDYERSDYGGTGPAAVPTATLTPEEQQAMSGTIAPVLHAEPEADPDLVPHEDAW